MDGRLRLACDNTAVVDGINKCSIRGEAIYLLQTTLLIAALFDIEILAFWIPSEENIIADAASRYDFKKLANLGFQVPGSHNRDTKISILRHKLFNFLTMHWHPQQGRTTTPPVPRTNLSVTSTVTFLSLQQSSQSHTGLRKLCGWRSQTRRKVIDLIIREGKRLYGEGEKCLRLPLTAPILCRIVNEIQENYDGFNFKAALCVAFARFLRSGEFRWDSPVNCLPRSSIAFNFDNSVILTLSSSKTDPFRCGVASHLAPSPNSSICPVNTLKQFYLFCSHPSNHPLFSRSSGPFSRCYFVDKIKELPLRAGISTAGFSGHSLRKGAAVSAAANGLSKDEIKLLVRWKSDAVDVYIIVPCISLGTSV